TLLHCIDEAIKEFVHPIAAQRYGNPHRHSRTRLEGSNRLLGFCDNRLLAAHSGELHRSLVEHLRVGLRLAPDSHIENHLFKPWHRHGVLVIKLLHQRRYYLFLIAFSKSGCHLRFLVTDAMRDLAFSVYSAPFAPNQSAAGPHLRLLFFDRRAAFLARSMSLPFLHHLMSLASPWCT